MDARTRMTIYLNETTAEDSIYRYQERYVLVDSWYRDRDITREKAGRQASKNIYFIVLGMV